VCRAWVKDHAAPGRRVVEQGVCLGSRVGGSSTSVFGSAVSGGPTCTGLAPAPGLALNVL
jgi:hypothetical protein